MATVALIALAVIPLLIAAHGYRKFEHRERCREDEHKLRRTLATRPGITVSLRKPTTHIRREQLRVKGRAQVTGLDLDGQPTETYTAYIDIVIPVTRGIASAADVDGVSRIDVTINNGEVDLVDVEYKCGLRMSVQHYPTADVRSVHA